jgi:hypothetical protein
MSLAVVAKLRVELRAQSGGVWPSMVPHGLFYDVHKYYLEYYT